MGQPSTGNVQSRPSILESQKSTLPPIDHSVESKDAPVQHNFQSHQLKAPSAQQKYTAQEIERKRLEARQRLLQRKQQQR
ncbi:hypothetical protein B566_EDAN009848 [Ephemera danica]|nr:hypothetical protein B566_EDAN009848 [Ephemera danica]